MSRFGEGVNAVITAACNLACEHCCCRDLPRFAGQDPSALWKRNVRIACKRLVISGGEPTLYPDLGLVVDRAREAMEFDQLILATNGAELRRHAGVLDRFDVVRLSVYPGRNDEAYKDAVRLSLERTFKLEASVPSHRGCDWASKRPCGRAHATLGLVGDRLYPCCVSPGITDAPYTLATQGWQERIADVTLPCVACVFAEE